MRSCLRHACQAQIHVCTERGGPSESASAPPAESATSAAAVTRFQRSGGARLTHTPRPTPCAPKLARRSRTRRARGLQARTAPRAALRCAAPRSCAWQPASAPTCTARATRTGACGEANRPDAARPRSYAPPSLRRALRGPRVRSAAAHGAAHHARAQLAPGCRVLTPCVALPTQV